MRTKATRELRGLRITCTHKGSKLLGEIVAMRRQPPKRVSQASSPEAIERGVEGGENLPPLNKGQFGNADIGMQAQRMLIRVKQSH
ncbi:MAG: hypothetical protein KAW09_09710 [Thermoplasmata archaeon]|nr:hypothetical protein [Thermoplasmata archaeon]